MKFLSLLLLAPMMLAGGVPAVPQEEKETSLMDVFGKDFLIGTVVSPRDFHGMAERYNFIKQNFNVITAENAMKPVSLQRERGIFTFNAVDGMLDIARSDGFVVHGHTLVWHNQSPAWQNTGVTRAEAERHLKSHINTVVNHYAGQVISWDVLNEAMKDEPATPDDWRSSLRRSEWYNAFAQEGDGADYIYLAFTLARAADPNAVLYYNDYNLDNHNKALAVYNMVKELNEKYLAEGNSRLLIEGVGMQAHYKLETDINDVENSIKLFAGLGVEISISELDVGVPNVAPTGLTKEQELAQAGKYVQLFSLFRKYSNVIKRVTIWGTDDSTSWRFPEFPLLFNRDLSPKLAYSAITAPAPDDFILEQTNKLKDAEITATPEPESTSEQQPMIEEPAIEESIIEEIIVDESANEQSTVEVEQDEEPADVNNTPQKVPPVCEKTEVFLESEISTLEKKIKQLSPHFALFALSAAVSATAAFWVYLKSKQKNLKRKK